MNFPVFKTINTPQGVGVFAHHYSQCSGFNVGRDYYESSQLFGVYFQRRMIGGFVLGTGSVLRTLEVFAGDQYRTDLYQKIQQSGDSTEICCFWIAPEFRKNTWLNFFVWVCVAYALQKYGSGHLVFGTNSTRLAALYNNASKSNLLHTDYLNGKRTFIFCGPRKYCLLGVAEILYYKIKRLVKIIGNRDRSFSQVAM